MEFVAIRVVASKVFALPMREPSWKSGPWWNGTDRDIDLYHWSSERFSAAWKATISVLVAKGRARVGVAAAAADWPKRIRDLQFLDHEGYATAT